MQSGSFNMLFCIICKLLLILPLSGNSQSGDFVVSIAELEASPGTVINVPVTADGLTNVAALRFTITFDANVLSKPEGGNIVQNIHPSLMGLGQNLFKNDSLVLNWFSAINPATFADGTKLFDLQFLFCTDLVSCAASQSESGLIFISPIIYQFIQGTLNILPVNYFDGSVFSNTPYRLLQISSEGEGEVFVNGDIYTGPLVVNKGTALTLNAAPNDHWYFEGWFENQTIVSDQKELHIVMDYSRHLLALFLEEEEPDIPESLDLNDMVIQDTQCFNALQTIITGGEDTFIVENGGDVTLIAGHNIIMKTGTRIKNGAVFHAFITADEEFCEPPAVASIPVNDEDDSLAHMPEEKMAANQDLFMVYPNPTRGDVNIVINQSFSDKNIKVQVYSMQGNLVLSKTRLAENTFSLNLDDQKPGMYLIRLIAGEETAVKRIIKH